MMKNFLMFSGLLTGINGFAADQSATLFVVANTNAEPVASGKFEPTWTSLKQYQCPQWFRDAKFGIWVHWGPQCQPEDGDWYARGIPRQAVKAATPIEGSKFTAADAGDPNNKGGWCPDMFGVRNNEAGQAWYDSCARLWAAWGVDFIKVDDLSRPYHASEIEMIRKALDRCGRPIVFSTSPGPTDPKEAAHISRQANMWRVSGDFWDRWGDTYRSGLNHQFELLAQWQGVGGPGHWPDLDMIPFGHIGIKCTIAGGDRQSRFTKDEERTLMSLWALAPSPLMLGANLPDLDTWTLSLLTNDEVLAVDQDPLGSPARRVTQADGAEIWVKELKGGDKAIGLFNRSDAAQNVELNWSAAGLTGKQMLRDLWAHKNLGVFKEKFVMQVPSRGAVLLRADRENVTEQKPGGGE